MTVLCAAKPWCLLRNQERPHVPVPLQLLRAAAKPGSATSAPGRHCVPAQPLPPAGLLPSFMLLLLLVLLVIVVLALCRGLCKVRAVCGGVPRPRCSRRPTCKVFSHSRLRSTEPSAAPYLICHACYVCKTNSVGP